jgi:hypothetical protein
MIGLPRTVSLLEIMRQFKVVPFVEFASLAGGVMSLLHVPQGANPDVPLDDSSRKSMDRQAQLIEEACKDIGLRNSLAVAKRLRLTLSKPPCQFKWVERNCSDLQSRIHDELVDRLFFVIDPNLSEYCQRRLKLHTFGGPELHTWA